MKRFRLFFIFAALLIPLHSHAQFYSLGDDPGHVKWYSIDSPEYRIIYPEGLDSLAKVYGRLLEKYRIPVSRSAGYVPGEMTSRRMPVILHPYNAMSNGSVAWAPMRMDLFTSPEASGAEAMPWEKMLAIHESRHVAQMQFGMSHALRPFNWIFGEMFTGAMAGIYPCRWLMEGDAVVAETALTEAGRGRSADFLNYFMPAFDSGDFRTWDRWRYGSYRHYTPDHYAVGYMAISGLRYMSSDPGFTGTYLHYAARRPYDPLSYWKISRSLTGKGFRDAFDESMKTYHGIWSMEKERRRPFTPSIQMVKTPRRHIEYSELIATDSTLYALKEGLGKSRVMVMLDKDGKEHHVTSFGNISGPLSMSQDRIWWSEYVSDKRWSLKVSSVIMYYDLRTGKKRSFTRSGKRFCPSISPDGQSLMTISYPLHGGSEIEVFSIRSGKCVAAAVMPDSLQVTETVWLGDRIYAAGISEHGYGLYSIQDFTSGGLPDTGTDAVARKTSPAMTQELGPEPVKITRLHVNGGDILFTSDKNGVNELYRYSPQTRRLYQMTSTEYGAEGFAFSPDRKKLYFSASSAAGKIIRCSDTADLLEKETSFEDIHRYVIPDALSAQEKELAETDSVCTGKAYTGKQNLPQGETVFSEPERYRKFPHLFHIHSWAPLYVDVDDIMSMSYDDYDQSVTLGATAILQNSLGTMKGSLGYSAHKDPYDFSMWRHSGHASLTYSGLYPVIEASVDFNDRAARNYGFNGYIMPDRQSWLLYMTGTASAKPFVQGNLSVYIPFNLSSGGWSRGIIPQVSYSISNDIYSTGTVFYNLQQIGEDLLNPVFDSYTPGKRVLDQRLSGSVRAYVMRPAAHSEIYPDLGIGMEAGAVFYPGMTDWFSPAGYLYLYGYLPGITDTQGLRITATYQKQLNKEARYSTRLVNTLPRGFVFAGDLADVIAGKPGSAKFTADYAIPVHLGDFSITSAFYVKRAVVTPHFDWTIFNGGGLYSAGITAQIEFGCFFWIGAPVSIGLTYSWNGGPSFESLAAENISMNRYYIGPAFSFSLPY